MIKEINNIMSKIKGNLWLPCTDESMRFNSRNLLTERLTALFVISSLPDMKIEEFKQMMETDNENQMTLQEKLEIYNKKLSSELTKRMKL